MHRSWVISGFVIFFGLVQLRHCFQWVKEVRIHWKWEGIFFFLAKELWEGLEELSQLNAELLHRGEPLPDE